MHESIKALSALEDVPANKAVIEQLNIDIRAGEAAIEVLVERNVRLVYSMLKNYRARRLTHDDLVQLGYIGLADAAKKYDYRKGARFATYARDWIHHHISRSIKNFDFLIGRSVAKTDMLSRVIRTKNEYICKTGEEPSLEQLSSLTNLSVDVIVELESMPTVSSLDNEINDGQMDTYLDLFEDTDSQNQEDQYNEELLRYALNEQMAVLTENERALITFIYGLGNHKGRTFKEAAVFFGKTEGALRQMERRALEKMRNNSSLESLSELEVPPLIYYG